MTRMTKDKPNSPDFSELRRQAEDRFAAKQRESGQPPSYVEKLLHELEVHRIELELQNEELRNTQVQLQESFMEYADLYDFAPVGYLTLNEKGLILKANLAGAALLGVERSKLIKKPLRTFIANESWAVFEDFRRTLFRTLTKQLCEVKLLGKGSLSAHALIEGIVLEDRPESERQCRIAIIDITDRKRAEVALRQAHDELEQRVRERTTELVVANQELQAEITERMQAEEALRESEERYRMLLSKAHDAIYLLELTPEGDYGKFIEVNDNLCLMLGYTKEELEAMSIMDAISPESRDDVLRTREKLLKEKHLLTERILVGKDGQRVSVEVSSHLFDYKGRQAVFTIARDITARKRSEEILRESTIKYRKLSQQFDAILTAIIDTLVLISPDLRVMWTNNGAIDQLDVPPAAMNERYYYELFCGLTAPCPDCPVTKCFLTGERATVVSNDSGRFLDKRAFPVKDGDKVSSVILLVSDITEKMTVQAEAMLASHLASLGELAAGVAHEINNPINGIINCAQILINECRPESLENDIGRRIVKEGDRIAAIVKSLLSFARVEKEDKRPARIDHILKEALVLTQGQIRKECIRLDVDLADDLPEIEANFQQIQQVFLNLVDNARYALNDKYPARDENKAIEIRGQRVRINAREYVRITFLDRGVGIPADKVSMITRPFFSTKPLGKGTGLGLTISDKIITKHGGRLTIESVKGEFTRVTIDFPAKWPQ